MHTVTIEILRSGEPNGMQLSKETRYIALCNTCPPTSLMIDFDQATLDHYKQLLQYGEVDESARQEGLTFFQEHMTKILDDIKPLRTEGKTDDWLHLRMVMSPRELTQLPFELTLTPEGFQGHNLRKCFLVNSQRLTTLTREVRQVASARYLWPHKPRILFAWCEPKGSVPYKEHYDKLFEIVRSYASPIKNSAEPVPDMAPLITSLKCASLKSINVAIKAALGEKNPYTHIHVLAHGSEIQDSKGEVFKLLMHNNNDINKAYAASGEELANAIIETDDKGTNFPAIVSLMVCDSANQGKNTLPAGSLAHQLHESGIPCIFASQFKLSKEGSIRLVSALYKELLIAGKDPRKALYETRKELNNGETHDWASLVAYVRFPEDMEEQLNTNRLKILLEAMKTANNWTDHVLKYKDIMTIENKESVFQSVSDRLDRAIQDLSSLFSEGFDEEEDLYAEHYGLLGSALKRKAEHLFRMAELSKERTSLLFSDSVKALNESRQWYFKGYDKQKNHWNAVQYLSLTAVTEGSLNGQKERDIWTVAKILAETDTKEDKRPMVRIWAWGTLAELYLLYPCTLPSDQPNFDKERLSAKDKALQYIDNLIKAKSQYSDHPKVKPKEIVFAQESTCRQFDRYVSWWPVMMKSSSINLLKEMATEFLKCFPL